MEKELLEKAKSLDARIEGAKQNIRRLKDSHHHRAIVIKTTEFAIPVHSYDVAETIYYKVLTDWETQLSKLEEELASL